MDFLCCIWTQVHDALGGTGLACGGRQGGHDTTDSFGELLKPHLPHARLMVWGTRTRQQKCRHPAHPTAWGCLAWSRLCSGVTAGLRAQLQNCRLPIFLPSHDCGSLGRCGESCPSLVL